jgi:hypothetical protein
MHSKILVIISPTKNIRLDVENILYPYNIDLTVPEHIYKTKKEWVQEETKKYVGLYLAVVKSNNVAESEKTMTKSQSRVDQLEMFIERNNSTLMRFKRMLTNSEEIKSRLMEKGFSFDDSDNIISWNNDINGKFHSYEIGGKYESSINRMNNGEIKRCTSCTILDFTFDEISDDDPTHIPISKEAKALPIAIVSEEIGWHDIKGKNKEEANKELKKIIEKKQKSTQKIVVVDIIN